MAEMSSWEEVCAAKAHLLARVPGVSPRIGIVLGSGLGNFKKRIEIRAEIPYSEIPHFRPTSVEGHAGNLIFGRVGGVEVVCQEGRYHYYEGHAIQDTILPVRVMAQLGIEGLLVSNAAGGINLDYRVGDIMLIRDHINFQGTNPLIGHNDKQFGPRFPDMTEPYDAQYGELLQSVALQLGMCPKSGVYISVTGPSYETPAEIRAFRLLGADAVGMSTVNEVIAARHMGLRVLGLSCIANAASGMGTEKLDHSDVYAAIEAMGGRFEDLVEKWLEAL